MILVCGEALYDLFLDSEENAQLKFDGRPGGSPFNVAFGLARLGQKSSFLTGLSTDFLGEHLMQVLKRENVHTGFIKLFANRSTLSVVGLDAQGMPAYAFYGDNAADRAVQAEDLPELGPEVSAIHLSSFSTVVDPIGSTLATLVKRHSASKLISFDPNIRLNVEPDIKVWHAKIEELVPFTHLLKISSEDFELIYGKEEPEARAKTWLAQGVRLVILTRGSEGVTAWTKAHRVDVPAEKIKLVDTVGAGDTFQAATFTALSEAGKLSPAGIDSLEKAALEHYLSFASRAAAITCSRRGADLPFRRELPDRF